MSLATTTIPSQFHQDSQAPLFDLYHFVSETETDCFDWSFPFVKSIPQTLVKNRSSEDDVWLKDSIDAYHVLKIYAQPSVHAHKPICFLIVLKQNTSPAYLSNTFSKRSRSNNPLPATPCVPRLHHSRFKGDTILPAKQKRPSRAAPARRERKSAPAGRRAPIGPATDTGAASSAGQRGRSHAR